MASVKAFAILASNYRDVSYRKSTSCIGESRESGRLSWVALFLNLLGQIITPVVYFCRIVPLQAWLRLFKSSEYQLETTEWLPVSLISVDDESLYHWYGVTNSPYHLCGESMGLWVCSNTKKNCCAQLLVKRRPFIRQNQNYQFR